MGKQHQQLISLRKKLLGICLGVPWCATICSKKIGARKVAISKLQFVKTRDLRVYGPLTGKGFYQYWKAKIQEATCHSCRWSWHCPQTHPGRNTEITSFIRVKSSDLCPCRKYSQPFIFFYKVELKWI